MAIGGVWHFATWTDGIWAFGTWGTPSFMADEFIPVSAVGRFMRVTR